MEPKRNPSIVESFRRAFAGFKDVMRTERNAKIHALVTVLVVALIFWLKLSAIQGCLVVLSIMGVWVAETLNTVLEILTDMVSPNFSKQAGRVKDIAAAAVLIASFVAVIIGISILGPALIQRMSAFL